MLGKTSRIINTNPTKILLVDDKPNNLRFLSKILTDRGYKVQRAISGQLALNAAFASPPDLILLDIMMPEMDGKEVCRRLKAMEKTKEIPVIFLSALNETPEKVKAFRVGGVDYVTKPFQVEELIARIENQLTIQKLSKQLKEQNTLLQQEISDRKRTEAALVERIKLAALNSDVGVALTQGSSLQDMQGRCASALLEHLNAAISCIWTLNEAENVLELQASAGMCEYLNETQRRVRVGHGQIGAIAREYQPLIDCGFSLGDRETGNGSMHLGLRDFDEQLKVSESNGQFNHPEFTSSLCTCQPALQNSQCEKEMVAFAGYPLMVKNRLVGVMAIFARHRLTEATLQAMASIANGIALGIDRFHSEQKLRRSEANLAAAQRVAHVGSWEFDVLTQKITWSEELLRIFGLDPTGLEPTYAQLLKRIHRADRALWKKSVEQALKSGKSYESDFRIVRPDSESVALTTLGVSGSVRYVEARGTAIFDERGQVIRLFGTVVDITERKLAEKALRGSEAREREKTKELELTIGQLKRTQAQLIHAEKMSSLGQMVAGVAHEINNPVSFIYGNLAVAREYFQDLNRLLEIYQQTYPHPTPEIRQVTEEIDWNFLVDDWQKLMNSMEVGAERIQQIVRSLRIFSRLDESQLKPVNIHESIDNTLLLLQHRLKAKGDASEIEVIKNYGQLPKVTCHASQLNQVFMNLLSNAIDALETQPAPRRITIHTSVGNGEMGREGDGERGRWGEGEISKIGKIGTLNSSSPPSSLHPRTSSRCAITPSPNPESVIIQIADNGPGMSKDVQAQIFDPFFTTKPVGKGTGLGLAISYQIVVEKHQGHISCVSAPGQGAQFIIEIPVTAIILTNHTN